MLGDYFYFIGVTLLLPVWLFLFMRKTSRKDMLLVGILMGIVAIIFEHLYAKYDYWQPVYLFSEFPFEDFYYGFIFGGISAEIGEQLVGKGNSIRREFPVRIKLLPIFIVIGFVGFVVCVDVLSLNSITAHIIAPLIVGLVTIFYRIDLLPGMLFSGLIMTILTFLMFQTLLIINPTLFENFWMLENLSGIYILNIPIEEYLFAFLVGFAAGNIYEMLYGYKIVNMKNN